jgi:hypothetical protein
LGREDPYASVSPLMTAVVEHVLDTALLLAGRSGWGRLCPPMLACLDEPALQRRCQRCGPGWPTNERSGSRKRGRCSG